VDARVIRAFTPVFDGLCPRTTRIDIAFHIVIPGRRDSGEPGIFFNPARFRIDRARRGRPE
jgi:hypothetical protein